MVSGWECWIWDGFLEPLCDRLVGGTNPDDVVTFVCVWCVTETWDDFLNIQWDALEGDVETGCDNLDVVPPCEKN